MLLDGELRTPCTTRPFRIAAMLSSHAKRVVLQIGTTELYMEPSSHSNPSCSSSWGVLALNVFLGYFFARAKK